MKKKPIMNRKLFFFISAGLTASAFAAVVFTFVLSWISIRNSFHQLNDVNVPALSVVTEGALHITKARLELYRYIHHYEPTPFRIQKHLNQIQKNLILLDRQQLSERSKRLVGNLLEDIGRFLNTLDQLERQMNEDDSMRVALITDQLLARFAAMSAIAGHFKDATTKNILRDNNEIKRLLLRTNAILTGISLLVVIMLTAGLLLYNRRLQRQVQASTDELQKRLHQLERSEARFRELTDLLPQTVFEANFQGRLTYTNKAGFEAFGYTVKDFENGMNIMDMMVAEECDKARGRLKHIMTGESVPAIEYTALRKDGTTFPVMVYASPIRHDAQLTGFRGIVLDITEQRRLTQEYRQAQKVESIGRLAGGIAHDLNNLLSPIIGYSEILQDEIPVEDPRQQSVVEIMNAGLRARDLVHQLLAFSRKQTLEFREVEINDIVAGFEKFLRRTIQEDIQLKLLLSSDPLPVMADIGQVEQVLMNLATNAADAMPGGGMLTIETAYMNVDKKYADEHTSVEPGPYALMAVSDTGCGMDEDIRENIFEPFFSTKGEGGTGLGLATVYGIVKQHNGNIWVYSEPGKGTTLKIYLPIREVTVGKGPVEKTEPVELTGSETIMLVEDNEQVRHITRKILEKLGYKILVAENGKAALSLFESYDGPLDLLLSDVVMPEMNGKDLYARVSERRPDLKVLFMSGYTGNVIASHGVLDDGEAFIQKPFSVHSLSVMVRETLDR